MLLNCALKLVEEIILYYDARSKIHQIRQKHHNILLYVYCPSCYMIYFCIRLYKLQIHSKFTVEVKIDHNFLWLKILQKKFFLKQHVYKNEVEISVFTKNATYFSKCTYVTAA